MLQTLSTCLFGKKKTAVTLEPIKPALTIKATNLESLVKSWNEPLLRRALGNYEKQPTEKQLVDLAYCVINYLFANNDYGDLATVTRVSNRFIQLLRVVDTPTADAMVAYRSYDLGDRSNHTFFEVIKHFLSQLDSYERIDSKGQARTKSCKAYQLLLEKILVQLKLFFCKVSEGATIQGLAGLNQWRVSPGRGDSKAFHQDFQSYVLQFKNTRALTKLVLSGTYELPPFLITFHQKQNTDFQKSSAAVRASLSLLFSVDIQPYVAIVQDCLFGEESTAERGLYGEKGAAERSLFCP